MRLEISLLLSLALLGTSMIYLSNAASPAPPEYWLATRRGVQTFGYESRRLSEAFLALLHVNDTMYVDARATGCDVVKYGVKVVHFSSGLAYEYEGERPPTFTASLGGVHVVEVEVEVRPSGGECSILIEVNANRGVKEGYLRLYRIEVGAGALLTAVVGLRAVGKLRKVV